jgi:hypothetical protein
LIRRLTLCFSIISIAQGSSAFMVVTGACTRGPRTHLCVGGSGLRSAANPGQPLLKWPACPHWKHAFGFGLCSRRTSLSAVIRASCCLSFLPQTQLKTSVQCKPWRAFYWRVLKTNFSVICTAQETLLSPTKFQRIKLRWTREVGSRERATEWQPIVMGQYCDTSWDGKAKHQVRW